MEFQANKMNTVVVQEYHLHLKLSRDGHSEFLRRDFSNRYPPRGLRWNTLSSPPDRLSQSLQQHDPARTIIRGERAIHGDSSQCHPCFGSVLHAGRRSRDGCVFLVQLYVFFSSYPSSLVPMAFYSFHSIRLYRIFPIFGISHMLNWFGSN